jgi:hypothetical protein
MFKEGSLGVVGPLTVETYVLGAIVLLDAPKDIDATQLVDVELSHGESRVVTVPLVVGLFSAHGPDDVNAEHAMGVEPSFARMSEISFQ